MTSDDESLPQWEHGHIKHVVTLVLISVTDLGDDKEHNDRAFLSFHSGKTLRAFQFSNAPPSKTST
jgi:hypothetical protein